MKSSKIEKNTEPITNLPWIYRDELFYHYLARYHFCSENPSYKDTLNDFFNSVSIIPTVEFPSNLKKVEEKLFTDTKLDCNLIINNHTVFPYYSPFLSENIKNQIISSMKYNDGKGLKTRIGMIAGGLCKSHGLRYCPSCVEEDFIINGEAYFHRIHQLQGVIICPFHKCIIQEYPSSDRSRIEFIRLEKKFTKSEYKFIEDKFIENKLLELSQGANYLLNSDLGFLNQNYIHERYKYLLKNKGYLSINGCVRQTDLCEEIVKYYRKELLNLLESEIEIQNEYNWVKVLTREPRRAVHPIRHLLLILFLTGSIEEFFEYSFKSVAGDDYYPCLNPISDHYKEFVVSKCDITADYKTREPVGTFYCDCGFIYSRKMKDDIYKVGTIKSFGHIWMQRLTNIVDSKPSSLREIARQMKADPATIKKYCIKNGLPMTWKSSGMINIEISSESSMSKDSDINSITTQYIKNIMQYILKNRDLRLSISEIRKKFGKEYTWLYRYNRDMLNKILPKPLKPENNSTRVDWEDRDNEFFDKVKNEVEKLKSENVHYRITLNKIGRRLEILAVLEKFQNKLPRTCKLLQESLESVEAFQLRRIDSVYMNLKKDDEPIKEWVIYKKACIRNNCSNIVKERIRQLSNNDDVS